MKPRDLYERHVPAKIRGLIHTTLVGAGIGAGTALAGSIFKEVGAIQPMAADPTIRVPPGGFAEAERARQYRPHHHHRSRF